MLRSSAISCSSVTDFCFSSAISTRTRSGSESGAAKRGGGSGAQRTMETTGWVAWGEIRGGEQPTRGIGQKIRLTKKRVKAEERAPAARQKLTYRSGSRLM